MTNGVEKKYLVVECEETEAAVQACLDNTDKRLELMELYRTSSNKFLIIFRRGRALGPSV